MKSAPKKSYGQETKLLRVLRNILQKLVFRFLGITFLVTLLTELTFTFSKSALKEKHVDPQFGLLEENLFHFK